MLRNVVSNFLRQQATNDVDPTKIRVYVNVYDMLEPNYVTQFGYYTLGIGVFHSGVQIGDREYCFGGHNIPNVTGVFVIEPKIGIPELTLKQTIDMGTTDLSKREIEELLVALSDEFTGPSYNLLTRNCNHFTETFVDNLTHKPIPAWINRAAKIGSMFPCVVPYEWVQPPEFAEEAEDEVQGEEGEGEDFDEGRRSSTVSLLHSRRTAAPLCHDTNNSSPTASLTASSSSSSQLNYPHITKFQGIVYPDEA